MLFPRSASALPASDGDIICQRRRSRQKSKVSVDISPQRESEPGTSLFLMQDSCERLFLQTSTDAKAFYLRLVLFRESQIGWRVSEGKTAVALLFLFILQETRREEGICSLW